MHPCQALEPEGVASHPQSRQVPVVYAAGRGSWGAGWVTFDPPASPLGPGEEWLVRSVGAYLPAVFEEVLDLVDAVILTEKVCALARVGGGGSGQWGSQLP